MWGCGGAVRGPRRPFLYTRAMPILAIVVAAVLAQPVTPGGQPAPPGPIVPAPAPESLLTQWPAEQRTQYLEQERALNAVPTPDSLRATHMLLASEPHVAGTEGDTRE